MKFSYFPGCTLSGTASEFGDSTEVVFDALGLELRELPEWVCCGATSAHALDAELAIDLPAHNLELATKDGLDVVVPCAACFNRMQIAYRALAERGQKLDFRVVHPVTVIAELFSREELEQRLKKTLDGLKVVAYYGCLLVRPEEDTNFDDRENPVCLHRLVVSLGADVRDWSYKAECCGGGLALGRPDIVTARVREHVDMAIDAGAEAIVTACPMCHANLDMRQWTARDSESPAPELPVFYVTELLAYCLGHDGWQRWLKKHMIPCLDLLEGAPA